MRLNPKPINDMTFPKKNNKNVLFFRRFDMKGYLNNVTRDNEK